MGILFVCTGNICRSPAAEVILRAELPDDTDLTVASAGLDAVVHAPIAPPVVDLLHGVGLDATGFSARSLERSMVDESDLVLTMTRRQRAAVVRIAPTALRRTFTLTELMRLVPTLDLTEYPDSRQAIGKRVKWLGEQCALARTAPRRAKGDDIADPYGGSARAYRRAVEAIERDVRHLAQVLTA